ncbi:MAG: N-acyl homoserine lactonase family protein [Gammaproteobacteria bacterium]|nr:N-acyl homoserine lactonase family protein [Gammaproteobacteria bacterium]MCP5199136.1 N-acyl homoserine lactonase family protein [Gammaproteobacteria bacterium]
MTCTHRAARLCILLLTAALAAGHLVNASAEGGAIKLYQVSSGVLELDKGWLTAMRDVGKKIKVPVAMYIIDHPRGLVVYDTGNNVAVSDGQCESYWGKLCGAFLAIQKREDVIDKQLEKFGYKTSDVKYLVLSHMHLDHAGNMEMFPNATIVVQKAEMKTAWWPEKFQAAAFVLGDYDDARNFNYLELDGDFDLFGDGSVVVLDTKGHTQGHQSLMVKLANTGTLFLAGDAVYTPENEAGVIPGITWNTYESMQSINRLKMLRDAHQGELWYSHGAEQYDAHKHDTYYD